MKSNAEAIITFPMNKLMYVYYFITNYALLIVLLVLGYLVFSIFIGNWVLKLKEVFKKWKMKMKAKK